MASKTASWLSLINQYSDVKSIWCTYESIQPNGCSQPEEFLERLHHVEKRVVNVLELAGGVIEELGNSMGPRIEVLNHHCREFMQSIREVQMTLREEIKSAVNTGPLRSVIIVQEYLMRSVSRNWNMSSSNWMSWNRALVGTIVPFD